MSPLLLALELLWTCFFAGVTIAAYSISDGSAVARAVRQDIAPLGTHIAVTLVVFYGRCGTLWPLLLFAFELFRDVMNGVNIQVFSPLRTYNHGLWVAAVILVWYQVGLSFVGMAVCAVDYSTRRDAGVCVK